MRRDPSDKLEHPAFEVDDHSRAAIEGASLGTWDWNVTTDEVYWNAQHFELFGMTPQEESVSSEAFFSHVYTEDRAWLSERLLQCRDNQEFFEAEFRAVLEDGTLRWMHGYGQVTDAKEGKPTRMSGVMMDVTERKQSEEKVLESEAHFRTLAESLPLIVSLAYSDGRIEYINPFWTTFSGRTLEDFITGDWLNAVYPEDQMMMLERWQNALVTGQPYQYEFRALAKDGKYRWLFARGEPVRNEAGHITRWVNTALDIHDRKTAEEASQKSEAKYRTLFDSIDEGFCIIEVLFDEDGKPFDYRFLEANPAFVKQTGLVDSTGKTILELSPQHEKFWFDICGEIALTGEAKRFEHQAEALNPPRFYDVYAFRVGESEEHKVAVIFNDISERKRAEQKLNETNQLLQATFDNSLQIIQVFKAVRDERGDIIDFEWLMTNARWNELYGSNAGKRLLAENPAVIETGLFDAFKQVTETGVALTQEHYYKHEQFDGWFLQTVAKVNDGFLLSTLDISERKRLEQRQAFLLHLGDGLRPLRDAESIQGAVTRIARDFFGADRCYYCEIENGNAVIRRDASREGLPSVVGVYPLEGLPILGAVIEAGKPFVVENVYTSDLVDEPLRQLCIDMQIISYLDVPVIKDGKPVGILCITQSTPRAWKDFEVDLAVETAERTWAAVERARAEEALRSSEEKYRSLFESIDEGFAVIELERDESGKVVDWIYREANESLEKLSGLVNVVGRRVSEVIPNLEDVWFEKIQRVADTGIAERYEEYISDLDHWYSVHHSRIGGEGSSLIAFVFDDITERKERERQQDFLLTFSDALRAETNADDVANRALRMLYEQMSLDRCYIGVYRLEDDRADLTHQVGNERVPPLPDSIRLSDFPEAFQVVFGQTLVIEDFAQTQGLSDTDRRNIAALGLRALVAPCLRKGEHNPLWSIVAVSARPRRWTRGEIALIEEVTERTWAAMERAKAEAALQRSEERQRLLIESAKDFAIYTLDPERRVTSWNTGAQKIFGYSEKEIVGQVHDILFTPEDRAKGDPEREVETARITGRAGNERWHSRKDQSRFYGSGAVTPLLDDAGELLGFVKIMRDLTEQQRMTETLQDSEKALREADKRKNEFLAVLAHELRNPLAPIRTSLEIMKRTKNKELEEEAKAVIGRQTDQLVHLVDDLLDVSRITRGKIKLHKEKVDLREIVEMALESTRPLVEEKEHDLQVSLPFRNVELYGDKTRLAQVLLNLLNNAAKYTNPGGKISLSAVKENDVVVIRVTDTGVGIPAKDLPHVFDLFVRVERGGVEGLGIGLNLVKQLVEMHGGSVEAYSAGEGQGSEFRVRLPLMSQQSEAESKPSANETSREAEQQKESVQQNGKAAVRVLVVDDYEPNRKTIARLLRLMGHEVVTASGGEEGLEQLERFNPEVVLLDLNMPGMNGFETAKRIRELPRLNRLKLIALTGYGQDQDKERTRQAGFDAHLVKPVDAETLEDLLGS